MSERKPPLEGIKVLDLSRVLAGPWCTQTLADLGAEVIKVERPEGGDDTRKWGPPFLKDAQGADTSEAAYYLSANRNKRSITVDIGHPAGARLVRQLAAQCDVVVENFKVGGLQKYQLDYESLKALNPALIYCSITGFGQTGPLSSLPGYDFMIQGMGGLMSITGERDDLPGGGPQKAGVAVTDVVTGLYAAVAILGALQERHRSGLGQQIDLALLDCHVAMLANQNLNFMTSGVAPHREGNAHPNIVPYQVFKASDGELIVATGNDSQYRAFCKVIGRPDLGTHPDYLSNRERLKHRETLVPLLEAAMLVRARDYWVAELQKVGVPCGPINDLRQVFDNEQVRYRQVWRTLPHPLAGEAPTVASPLRFSATPVQYRSAPPLLGQHTQEILAEFGLQASAAALGRESN